MRNLVIILVAFLFVSCINAPVTRTESSSVSSTQGVTHEPEKTSVDSVQQFLLAVAASDFYAHGPTSIIRFREVRFRYLVSPKGEKTYLLCGEFLSEKKPAIHEWTPFVTIKTDPYEQWIGGQAATYCQGSSPASEKQDDLSSSLQSRFDSLR